jgi:nucleoside-diphosphate-sugar epimerase
MSLMPSAASPFHFHIEDNERDMLIPALRGSTNILSAIEKEPKVKHLVATSSFAATGDILGISLGKETEKIYTGTPDGSNRLIGAF